MRISSSFGLGKNPKRDASAGMTAFMTILRDPSLTAHLLEVIFDRGLERHSLSRLARTCRVLKEPSLSVLWRHLDSLKPLVNLFPNVIQRTFRGRDSMRPKDWSRILPYSSRVHSLNFTDHLISSYFWSFLERCHGGPEYILPNLMSLTWRSMSDESLSHFQLFLGPRLETFSLPYQDHYPSTEWIDKILPQIAAHRCLTTISLPLSDYTWSLEPAGSPSDVIWEKVVIDGPSRYLQDLLQNGPFIRWISALPRLHTFVWNVGSLSVIVETLRSVGDLDTTLGFSILPACNGDGGYSTGSILPTQDPKLDSDKTKQVKSVLHNCGDPQIFAQLTHLELSIKDVEYFGTFLMQLRNPLRKLSLKTTDALFRYQWDDVCLAICEHSGDTLETLEIRHKSIMRYRGGDAHIDLTLLAPLPRLRHLTIDFPYLRPVFDDEDVVDIAFTLPQLAELSLCPVVRFPQQDATPRRLIWNYASRDCHQGSVRYEEVFPAEQ
ncbi:hypothetical protein SCP_0402510 [Sparassis crispa]|uniref:F-box domain-containing protein n=1 Tax=Sparassis crispa TaxID=139825 RepID=A0A401GI71_9APHY|nr:hypothetical protein SCP_0402510 [Sparassis crispa]GBE81877.1 hypothetical protein SCP_0402510 [Sparassis crispa]